MNILFVCTANRFRSATAEHYFKDIYIKHNFASAGICKQSVKISLRVNPTAQVLSGKLCSWADVIYCMEDLHVKYITSRIDKCYLNKIIILDIDDVYTYMDIDLINKLKTLIKL